MPASVQSVFTAHARIVSVVLQESALMLLMHVALQALTASTSVQFGGLPPLKVMMPQQNPLVQSLGFVHWNAVLPSRRRARVGRRAGVVVRRRPSSCPCRCRPVSFVVPVSLAGAGVFVRAGVVLNGDVDCRRCRLRRRRCRRLRTRTRTPREARGRAER